MFSFPWPMHFHSWTFSKWLNTLFFFCVSHELKFLSKNQLLWLKIMSYPCKNNINMTRREVTRIPKYPQLSNGKCFDWVYAGELNWLRGACWIADAEPRTEDTSQYIYYMHIRPSINIRPRWSLPLSFVVDVRNKWLHVTCTSWLQREVSSR